MINSRTMRIAVAVIGLMCAPTLALAQSAQAPQAAPAMKTIGKPSTAKNELINSLIVMNSDGATLEGDKLTLLGVSANSIVFADRPVRLAGHELTSQLIEEWGTGNSFDKDPPNATVSAFNKDGSQVKDAVVVLKSPKLEGDKLIFTVKVLEGDLNGADGSAAIFIDIFGVWRRAAYRGALYAGAVAGTAAAYGAYAAPYYHPYGYYPPRCGYYPYPPCY